MRISKEDHVAGDGPAWPCLLRQPDAAQVREVGRAETVQQADRGAVGLDLLRAGAPTSTLVTAGLVSGNAIASAAAVVQPTG